MNQPIFLNLVERLESFLGKLPESIQRPVLKELTPMKELFLKQRSPRFVLTGSHRLPMQEVVASASEPPQAGGEPHDMLMELFRWHDVAVGNHGTLRILDARGADAAALRKIDEELQQQRP